MPVRNAGVSGSGSGSTGISDVASTTTEFRLVAAREGRPAHQRHKSRTTPRAAIATTIQSTTVPRGKLAVPWGAKVPRGKVGDTDGGLRGAGVCRASLQ